MHLYHGNATLLTDSLEVIQRTSALILSAMETKPVEAEQTSEQHATDAAVAGVA